MRVPAALFLRCGFVGRQLGFALLLMSASALTDGAASDRPDLIAWLAKNSGR
jgi:hypothetical protein